MEIWGNRRDERQHQVEMFGQRPCFISIRGPSYQAVFNCRTRVELA
uniref:Uncharacterized protein n=1 Tax=Anguilla anguilla TaxID=7936 RepID=A0A0E9WFU3_ANGAN